MQTYTVFDMYFNYKVENKNHHKQTANQNNLSLLTMGSNGSLDGEFIMFDILDSSSSSNVILLTGDKLDVRGLLEEFDGVTSPDV